MFSKIWLVLFVLYIALESSSGQKAKHYFRPDYTYLEATQSFYKFHRTPLSWLEAKARCALEGAILFHPTDGAEAQVAISFWNATQPAINGIYLGLSDMISEGEFLTVDGKSVGDVYSNWLAKQPDNHQDEDCASMNQDGVMNDVLCSGRHSFMCKKRLESLQWNPSCNMSNLDYTLDSKSGKCFKLHTTPMDWTEAFTACSAELTNLAVIDNQEEANYIKKLMDSVPAQKIRGSFVRGMFHMGYHNRLNEGWTTVKGTRLNENSTVFWGGSVPDDNDSQQCGAMFYTGRLTPVDCSHRSLFVCEHQVDCLTMAEQ
ncbi:macrophage mannose receptor 1 [Helicoverpa armigera]|uniref:macrophage mannose receptor 1 n=1 Tax=Helicoverpa armigera TaxID=29058 RepID=UPI003083055A